MRGELSVDDFLKMAAGVIVGIIILYIMWVFVSNYTSTECWKSTAKPFDELILGTKSLQSGFGSSDFVVALNLKSYQDTDKHCLQEIFFIRGQYRESICEDDCQKGVSSSWWRQDRTHQSSIVSSCKEECSKNCKDSDCILLMPKPTFVQSYILSLNKPKVYGSGNYGFTWDSKWDQTTLVPGGDERCIVFTMQEDGKTYFVEPTTDAGRCK
jgi:hypothetical protein